MASLFTLASILLIVYYIIGIIIECVKERKDYVFDKPPVVLTIRIVSLTVWMLLACGMNPSSWLAYLFFVFWYVLTIAVAWNLHHTGGTLKKSGIFSTLIGYVFVLWLTYVCGCFDLAIAYYHAAF